MDLGLHKITHRPIYFFTAEGSYQRTKVGCLAGPTNREKMHSTQKKGEKSQLYDEKGPLMWGMEVTCCGKHVT
jgi:hypothetical protein